MNPKNNEKETTTSKLLLFHKMEEQKRIVFGALAVMVFLVAAVFCYVFIRFHSIDQQMEELRTQTKETLAQQSEYQVVESSSEDETLAGASEEELPVEETKKTVKKEDEIVDDVRVYLTFDDGPGPYTNQILDILKKYHVKATFFVIAQENEKYREVYQRIVNEGHTLAMHSYTHDYSIIYASPEAFEKDVLDLQAFLYDRTGVTCQFYRFPGGSNNHVSTISMKSQLPFLEEHGIEYFDWNVDSMDAADPSEDPDTFIAHVVENVCSQPTSIVLMHDSSTFTTSVDALEGLINRLQTMGLRLLPITEDTDPVHFIEKKKSKS